MSPPVLGLVGVAGGVALNWFVATLAERRRDARQARAASRLLGRELVAALDALHSWTRAGSTDVPSREDALRFPAWQLYHEVAARTLKPAHWDAVSDAYLLLYPVRTSVAFAGRIDEPACAHLGRAKIAVEHALKALRANAKAEIRPLRS